MIPLVTNIYQKSLREMIFLQRNTQNQHFLIKMSESHEMHAAYDSESKP